jgi:two-component system sensor histidine kinase AgrC
LKISHQKNTIPCRSNRLGNHQGERAQYGLLFIAYIIFSIVFCVICTVSTKCLGYLFNIKLKLQQYLIDAQLLEGIFSFHLILTLFFIFLISYGEKLGYSYGVTAFSGIMFLALFAVTVFIMHSIYQNAQQNALFKHQLKQYENLQKYTQKLEKSYGTMRQFKHDYINIFTTISGFIEKDDLPSLKEYYQNKIAPLSHNFIETNHRLNDLMNISCLELKSILSSKLIYAMEIGIKTEIEIREPILYLNMDSLDLSRIIGIFMDNAIEAALETEEIELHFAMFYKNEALCIIIRNSAKLVSEYSIIETRKLGVSTKGDYRGIGLFNVTQILNNYSNIVWDTSFKAPYFSQELTIFPKNSKDKDPETYDAHLSLRGR